MFDHETAVRWIFLCVAASCWLCCAHAHSPRGFPEEAARLLRSIRLPPDRAMLVPTVLKDVELALQLRFPGCKGELYGSIATGLGLNQSDIDIYIKLSSHDSATMERPSQLVLEARGIVSRHPFFEVVEVKPEVKVPVLRVKHLPSGFNVDISFSNYNGVRNSKLVHHLMSLDERAKDLAQIIKYWAKINEVSNHTMLPSYGVVTLVIFYLQQKQILPPIVTLQKNAGEFLVNHWNMVFTEQKHATKNTKSLCSLLGGFFEYYNEFDFDNYVVSPYVGFPVEIDLFRDVDKLPEEFSMYRMNIGLNITRPLGLKPPVIQDSFEHNSNLAIRVTAPERRSRVQKLIQFAANEYKEGCPGLLKAIL